MHTVLITGGGGLLGHALRDLCPQAVFVTSHDADLRDIRQTEKLFQKIRPHRVLHLAARVGGVKINAAKNADLFTENVLINTNVLATAAQSGVERLISVLSSCVFENYPDRPSTEKDLHIGMPYSGNWGYGYAKRMIDIQTHLLAQQYGVNFSTVTPVTMYGPHDNWDLAEGHVLGALIHKGFIAKRHFLPLEVWGSGNAVRQFVYVKDVARLLLLGLERFSRPETVIIAPDKGIRIADLASKVAEALEFSGPVTFDTKKPEGVLVKTLRSERFGKIFPDFSFTPLETGLKETVEWFCENANSLTQAKESA